MLMASGKILRKRQRRYGVKHLLAAGLLLFEAQAAPYSGLSGLTQDRTGRWWAVAERDRVIVPLQLGNAPVLVSAEKESLIGIAAGLDTESVAALPDGTLALGTERHIANRDSDLVLLLQRHGTSWQVRDQLVLPYRLWNIRGAGNAGIEGLCFAAGQLIAASETVITEGHQRFAPLARYHPQRRAWTPYRLKLTTTTGRISALACRPAAPPATGVELLAIERHFAVSRLLRFHLPPADLPAAPLTTINAALLFDLAARLPPVDRANFEGLGFGPQGELLLIADNNYGGVVSGPTKILVLPQLTLQQAALDQRPVE